MKHSYYRKSMRILSIVLLITTMITSGAFAMYASELPVIVNELIASSQQQSTTVFSEPRLIPDDTFALLQRMSEYDTFTEEEKDKIYDLLGDAYDRESIAKAEEEQELYRVRFEQMPEEAKKEGTVRWLINDYGTYSNIPAEERSKLLEVLEINQDNFNSMDNLFRLLEQRNIDLFDSYLVIDIMADGTFTIEEALELYTDVPDRTVRDSNIFAFKSFISHFEKPVSAISNDLTAESADISLGFSGSLSTSNSPFNNSGAQLQPLKKYNSYNNAAAFEMAKSFFMEGYSTANIRAAFSVGYVLGISPTSLIIENTSVRNAAPMAKDVEEFSALFPVNLDTVSNNISRSSIVYEAQNTNSTEYELLIDLAAAAQNELYAAAGSSTQYGDLVEDKLVPPSKININDKESINLSTGDVLYSENLLHIPGMDGMDFDLNIKYNSGESNLTKFTNRVLVNRYRLDFVQTLYANTPFGLILLAEYPYSFVYNTRSEAETQRDYLMTRNGASAVLPYPYYDSRIITQQYYEYITYNGYLNPQELISVTTTPNPLPASIYYNDGLYYGTLPRGSSTLVYDSGIVINGTDFMTGRPMWTQILQYSTLFSGIVQATYTTGIETFSNFSITSYMETDDLNIQDNNYPSTYLEERYNIGSGWSFDLPAMEASFDSTVYQLHLPDRGSYQFTMSGYTPQFIHPITEEVSSTMFDMNISIDGTFTNGNLSSTFKLWMANGEKYYFDSYGKILGHTDKYGNTITYRYSATDAPYLTSITDTNGRTTYINYSFTDTGKRVDIIPPSNDSAITLILENMSGIHAGNYVLDRIIYPNNTYTSFTYIPVESKFSYSQKSNSSVGYYSALLSSVHYFTGAVLEYTYASTPVNLSGLGYRDIYRATSRTYRVNGVEYGKQFYTYSGDYSQYPSNAGLPDPGYLYATTIIENNNVRHLYTFNRYGMCVQESLYDGNATKSISTYTYNEDRYRIISATTLHGANNELNAVLSEFYTYDPLGNVLSYVSPKAQGDSSNAEYLTSYSYDYNFNMPLSTTYKRDADTTIRVSNTLSSDKKSVIETVTYENNSAKAKSTFSYDTYGRLLSQNDYTDVTAGTYVNTSYDYSGSYITEKTVFGITDADGVQQGYITERYTYDTLGRPLTTTDGAGNVTVTTYDLMGRTTSLVLPNGESATYIYNDSLNQTTFTKSGESAIIYSYNPLGLLTSEILASNSTVLKRYSYDNRGRVTSEYTSLNTVNYLYDNFDRIVSVVILDPQGNESYRETYLYEDVLSDGTSRVTKTIVGDTHAQNIITQTVTNQYGEKISEGSVLTPSSVSSVNHYDYNYIGEPVRTYYKNASGSNIDVAEYEYTYDGQIASETNGFNYTRYFTYDALGRKISESDFKGNTTYYTYDAAGRLLTQTTPFSSMSSSVKKYFYDGAGNIIKEMQSNNADNTSILSWKTTQYTYTGGNLTDVIVHSDSLNRQYTHYEYANGKMTKMYAGMSQPYSSLLTPADYALTQYTYDNRGNLMILTDALGQAESYAYDIYGNLISTTDRKGQVTRYTYNALGKVASDSVYANANAVTPLTSKSYVYAKTGSVSSEMEDGIVVTYTYDGMGNVASETENGGTVKSYSYDARGNLSSYQLLRNNAPVTSAIYEYDIAGRLTSVTEGGSTVSYTYDANGSRASMITSGSGVTTTYSYNKANMLVTLANSRNGVTLSSFNYTHYTDGNQRTKYDSTVAKTTTYTYDGAGRLTSENVGGVLTSYTYDAANNRISMTGNGSTTNYTYDKNNRLITETKDGVAKSYSYDANGNTLATGDATYTYDARNRQISHTAGINTTTYTYNPNGLRRTKTANGSTRYFVWSGMNLVFEYDSGSLGGTVYYYGINRTHSSEGEFYQYNGHGDVVQLTDSLGTIVQHYEYDAFGNEVEPSASDTNPFRYCGEYFDIESGTIYLRARYYDPAIGRFTQQDAWGYANPGDPLSLNLYVYCYGNPVRYKDSSGNIPVETIGDIVSILWSGIDLVANPSLANLGYLAWDIGAALLPYVPGSYVAKGIKFVGKADDVIGITKAFNKAQNALEAAEIFKKHSKSIVDSYTEIKKMVDSLGIKGYEVHHLIEKRFASVFGLKENDILSVALDKDTHKAITEKFRAKILYNLRDVEKMKQSDKVYTFTATPQNIWYAICYAYTETGNAQYIPMIREYLYNNANVELLSKISDWGGY